MHMGDNTANVNGDGSSSSDDVQDPRPAIFIDNIPYSASSRIANAMGDNTANVNGDGSSSSDDVQDPRPAIFFDIDNTPYSASSRIANAMDDNTANVNGDGSSSSDDVQDPRPVIFFDIDNTLYSASSRIANAMGTRIHAYFTSLGLSDEQASQMHLQYYKTYGLALRGLVKHHEVDPMDFDRKCDQSLPLEDMIGQDERVRRVLQDVDRNKFRVWALTNAYVVHARRVLSILGVDDQFEDVIYVDYAQPDFSCKPEPEYFLAAMKKANVSDPAKCYFIDDSLTNVKAARSLGWSHSVHFCETGLETMEGGVRKRIETPRSSTPISSTSLPLSATNGDTIAELEEPLVQVETLDGLRDVWPEIFKSTSGLEQETTI